jgi:hypothetical protein
MSQNINPNNILPSGISKHVYSTNPDGIVDDNLYTKDKSSFNKDESYQTLDNKVISTETHKKINPFNVKGVPGCRECGGSGWKDSKHPHPCNECAKKTVPIIDTFLTKVGQTSTPVIENVQIQKTKEVTEYVEQTKTIPVTKHIEVQKTVPITKNVPITETFPMQTTVPVTRNVEIIQEVPRTRNVQFTENVDVMRQVPITQNVNVTNSVPMTKTRQIIENIPVTTQVPVTENVEIIKIVPVLKHKQVVENIQVNERIPYTEQIEVTKTIPQTRYVNVTENLPTTTKITTHEDTRIGSSNIDNITHSLTNLNLEQNNNNTIINTGIPSNLTSLNYIKGVPGCKHCGGEGQFKSKSGKRMVPCKDCVSKTGTCLVCKNDGIRPDRPSKRCECMYGKQQH